MVPISFPIPLSQGVPAANTHFQTDPGFAAVCPGNVEEPTAPSGQVCVYSGFTTATFEVITDPEFSGSKRVGKPGGLIFFSGISDGAFGSGSWAVTGCGPTLPVGDPNRCP